MTHDEPHLNADPSVATPAMSGRHVFAVLWTELYDLMGAAAAATLVRRAARRASTRAPDLEHLVVTREKFGYRCIAPPIWETDVDLESRDVRALFRELRPLLVELTGPVVLRRLQGVPALLDICVASSEGEP